MAESHRNRPSRRQPSRLQSRAPSSLQINRAVNWNVAIPLLSPLASSPPPPTPPQKEDPQLQPRRQSSEPEKVIFTKWQHPAAPFCYEHSSSVVPPFCLAFPICCCFIAKMSLFTWHGKFGME
ncbi:hypothetical protein Fmac_024942 [Flemingia macrophylla]|uniref:Uncharacterized protein n=1 Tax=Flemingia macrophylla TaxID=520843 RepID=A0ABD1LQT7_9FABA